jgi:hypothetical protein
MRWLIIISVATCSCAAIQLAGDRIRDAGELLFLLLKIFSGCGGGVGVEPFSGFFNSLKDLLKVRNRFT